MIYFNIYDKNGNLVDFTDYELIALDYIAKYGGSYEIVREPFDILI